MDTTNFWIIIAVLYGLLAIATPIIAWLSSEYIKKVTEGATWPLKKSEGFKKDKDVGIFQPITRYLTWMMVIDLVVFVLACSVALKEAGIL